MLTRAILAEASALLASLDGWRKKRLDCQRIAQATAFGPNGTGLTIKLSDPIAGMVKLAAIAECDAQIAALLRRAAQMNLSVEP